MCENTPLSMNLEVVGRRKTFVLGDRWIVNKVFKRPLQPFALPGLVFNHTFSQHYTSTSGFR